MKILLLSCSTGEGHNHCALAVKEALDARGHETSFLDMLHMFGDPGPLSFDKILNRISTKAPDVFGMMYHAGAMYSATGVTSPVYMANIRHARQLNAFIRDNSYDAVVCSHLFPMETLTFLRRWERCDVKCCGILSDYTCIPFLAETDLDAYFLPHSEVRELCIQAGMPAEKLIVSGMPVAARFLAPIDKAAARAALGLPADSGGNSGASGGMTGAQVDLLARLISAEARGEPYSGQVAVGAVVLNRIRHPSFPNTLSGVIYQSGAFTCITDGQFNEPVAESAYRAARDALNGVDPSGGAIYYFNPSTATSAWIWSRPLITVIGKHRFCS